MTKKTVRLEVEKPDQHLIDCHLHVDDKKHSTIRIKKHEFSDFLERFHTEAYNRGTHVEELTITLG